MRWTFQIFLIFFRTLSVLFHYLLVLKVASQKLLTEKFIHFCLRKSFFTSSTKSFYTFLFIIEIQKVYQDIFYLRVGLFSLMLLGTLMGSFELEGVGCSGWDVAVRSLSTKAWWLRFTSLSPTHSSVSLTELLNTLSPSVFSSIKQG